MRQAAEEDRRVANERSRYWRLGSRFLGASMVATGVGQLAFLASYALMGVPAVAAALSWLAGAIPNFVLNRRTWGVSGKAGLRREIYRYGAISVVTALLAALSTSLAEAVAQDWFPQTRTLQVAVVWGVFLATYLVMFVVKFLLIDRLVFTAPPPQEQAR